MKKILTALILSAVFLAAYPACAQKGYSGVIAPDTGAGAAPATTGGGYSGVTSWDSIVSGSLYDFVNEAGQAMAAQGDDGNSTALAQLVRQKRRNLSSLLAEKNAIEQQRENDYYARKKQQVVRAMEERAYQRSLQRN